MFKALPKAFWIGLVIMYVYAGFFMVMEWTIPGFPLMKILGIPFCWIYNAIIGCWLLNMLLAAYFAFSEENREAKLEAKKQS